MRFGLSRRALLGSALMPLAGPALARIDTRPRYRDPQAPIDARVEDLLARMSLAEKVAQLRCMWERKRDILSDDYRFSPRKAADALKDGIGQIARPGDIRGFPAWETEPFLPLEASVRLVNDIQRFLMRETRLGIPALFHDEMAHGLLAGEATIFPIPPALASTWDPPLVEAVFAVAAREGRRRGATIALTPVVDLLRDPRWGRSEEFFSEDPHLVAEMGVAAVRGLQGTRPLAADKVFATLKHFVHATPQGGLNIGPAEVGERGLREAYLVPFERIVRRADPAAIMPSYNEVGGVPAHADVGLLQGTGRDRLGFRGLYMSDYEGIANLESQHHVAASKADAAVLAMRAGVAVDLPEGASYANLPALVADGRVSEAQVDAAVRQVLALKFEAGLFERPFLDARAARAGTGRAADVALARRAAERALILLKNDGLLPLRAGAGGRLAVIGPNAVEPLFGGYSGANAKAVGILEGIRRGAPAGLTVEHAEGVWITAPDARGRHLSYSSAPPVSEADDARRIAEAVALARRSDTVLLVVGDVPAVTREAVARELPGDRASLGLWGRQDALVRAIAATGKPIVTLVLSGRPLVLTEVAEASNALFQGWYLGQEGGNAFADILFGRASPGGKLTVSMPRSAGGLPCYYNRHPSAATNVYLDEAEGALFPFGHGLGYTRFELSAPRLSQASIRAGDSVGIEVDVRNVGERPGDEVVQLYLRDEVSSVPRPVLELKGFSRVAVAPGEMRTVAFRLTPDDLALWDAAMRWTVEPGAFTVSAGASSASLKSATLTVTA